MKAIEFLGKSFFIFAVLSLMSCVSLDSYTTSAYIENESDFAQKAFSAEYIDSWTGYKKRTYGLDEYFVDFDKTYFVSNKEYDAGSDTDYSFSSIKKHGGTLLKNNDGESYVLQTLFDQLCGAIIKIRGEEYAFLDFESKDRAIMLKNDFSQTLSEAEKDYVTSIIFLMCLFDDRFPNENTEPVINLDVHE